MAHLLVLKKVSLVSSLTEDVVTDEILNDIATRAKTEKGKKLKFKMNETGIRLTRVRLFQESQTKFFPIKTVQTVMQIPDFPKCVIFILSDPGKKYKIVALRCESETDAAKLASVFAEIQNKVQSENIELKKRENGNWTLRGRTNHNANQTLLEIFNENRQSNGDLRVIKTNGEVTYVPIIDASEGYRKESYPEGVPVRYDNNVVVEKVDKKDDSDDDDEYTIETEVTTDVYVPAKVLTDQDRHDVRIAPTKIDQSTIEDAHDNIWVSGKPQNYPYASALPSRPGVHRVTSLNAAPTTDVVYGTATRHVAPSQPVVYGASSARIVPPHPVVYRTTSKDVHPPQPVVYAATSPTMEPSQPVVYAATSSRSVSSQPDRHSISSRSYPSPNPVVTTTSAGYYTNPWAQRQGSISSSMVPFRLDGNPSSVTFDRQSMMSNTSRVSRFSRMRASDMSIPTTVNRSIETVYPRPVVFLRQTRGHVVGQRPRPASYHAHELRIYQEDNGETGVLL